MNCAGQLQSMNSFLQSLPVIFVIGHLLQEETISYVQGAVFLLEVYLPDHECQIKYAFAAANHQVQVAAMNILLQLIYIYNLCTIGI